MFLIISEIYLFLFRTHVIYIFILYAYDFNIVISRYLYIVIVPKELCQKGLYDFQ